MNSFEINTVSWVIIFTCLLFLTSALGVLVGMIMGWGAGVIIGTAMGMGVGEFVGATLEVLGGWIYWKG